MVRLRSDESPPEPLCRCGGESPAVLGYRWRLEGEDAYVRRYGEPCPHLLDEQAAYVARHPSKQR